MNLIKKISVSISFKKHSRYYIVGFIFFIWIAFLDSNSLITHNKLNKKIKATTEAIDTLKKTIKFDSLQLYNLEKESTIEKIAREDFLMKKPNEEIYLFQDSKKKE